MKIAVVTNNEKTISAHFGQAKYYLVFTVKDGEIVDRELRDKPVHQGRGHHQHGDHQHDDDPDHSHGHGQGRGLGRRNVATLAPVSDCEVVLARGMGQRFYGSALQAGIRVIITDLARPEEAVKAYLEGTLTNHTENLH